MSVRILVGDCRVRLAELAPESVHVCVTSPPYWNLRSYLPAEHPDKARELGSERTVEEYVANLVDVFRAVWRVLRKDGTVWLNLGDSFYGAGGANNNSGLSGRNIEAGATQDERDGPRVYGQRQQRHATLKPKDLVGIPWRVAFALQADGWWLRSDLIWRKPNPMPESVLDRPTRAHEYVFLLAKAERYFYDGDAIREPHSREPHSRDWWTETVGGPKVCEDRNDGGNRQGMGTTLGRNRRSVWTVSTQGFTGWHETVHRVPVARDALDGDTKRTTSPGCPVHGDRLVLVASAPCGEHAGGDLIHNGRNDGRLVPGQLSLPAPTDQIPCEDSGVGNLDLQGQQCAVFATDHSSENRKTAPVLATSPSCSACAQTPRRTEYSEEELSIVDLVGRKHENSSALAVSDDHLLAQTLDRNAGKFSCAIPPECTCTFYKEITKKSSHFATFPPALVESMILAGSPERCCPTCGAGWRRVVERSPYQPMVVPPGMRSVDASRGDKTRKLSGAVYREQVRVLHEYLQPGCPCPANDGSGRAVALDPFGGAGTVGLVADRLGRDAVLCELNEDYASLAESRIRSEAPLLADVAVEG